MSDDIIKFLFESRLMEWAEDNDVPLRVPNQPFEPPAYEDPTLNTYIDSALLSALPASLFLEGGTTYRGIYQMNIVTAKGLGAGAADAIKAGLDALFPANLRLTHSSGLTVQTLAKLQVGTGMSGDTTFTIPTGFPYRSDVA